MNSLKFLNLLLDPKQKLVVERFGRTRVPESWCLHQRIVSEHYLTMLVENEAIAEIAGRSYRLRPASLLWIQPGVPHSYRPADSAHPQTFYHLRFELPAKQNPRRLAADVIYLPQAQILRSAFEQLFDEHALEQDFTSVRFRALLIAFLADLLRLHEREEPGMKPAGLNGIQRQLLRDYVERHLAGALGARDLARVVQLTPDYFSRLFRATYGLSPRSWLLRERMRRAAEILAESNLGITEVAHALGYRDLFTFSRLFKQCHGQSPRHYRLTHG
jgi:AraC-like DNA-binding protein/mannose-6-phosphate isomerase-like protein (cupin superfamily)